MEIPTSSKRPSAAKLAEEKALGHAAALSELVTEFPDGQRSPEDEQVLRELLQEGQQLRSNALEARPSLNHGFETDVHGNILSERDKEAIAHGQTDAYK